MSLLAPGEIMDGFWMDLDGFFFMDLDGFGWILYGFGWIWMDLD